ncbi:hypothetical protein ABPG72_004983 [Tetrahymena utriculariae]
MIQQFSENMLKVKLSGKNSQTLIDVSKKGDSFIYDDEVIYSAQNKTQLLNIGDVSFRASIEQSNISQNNSFIGLKNDQDDNLLKSKSCNISKLVLNNETATDYVEQEFKNSQVIKNLGSSFKQNHTRILQERTLDKIQKIEFQKAPQTSTINPTSQKIDEQIKIVSNGLNSIDKALGVKVF